ncbi:MAG: hypothetical protein AB7T37_07115 [Dehalococcoidia bacterium]
MTRTASIAAIGACMLLAACGGGGGETAIILRADGDATEATVQYRTPAGEFTEAVTLPWELETAVDGEWAVSVDVTNGGLTGSVSCAISGLKLPVRSEGEATATCRASGSGGSVETSANGSGFVKVNGEPRAVARVSYRATTGHPKAFALTGETAWTAAGGLLLGHDAGTGEEFRTSEANGVNGAARAEAGVVLAVDNNNLGDNPDTLVRRESDGTEEVLLSATSLAGPILGGPSAAWVMASEPKRVLRIDTGSGAVLAEWSGDQVLVAGDAERALLWDAAAKRLLLLDAKAAKVAEAAQTTEPVVVLTGNGFALRTVAGNTVSITLLHRDTLKPLGSAKVDLGLFPTLVAGEDGSLFAGGDTAASGIDPATGAVTCTVQTGSKLLGVSAQHLWLYAGESTIVALKRSDLGC